MQLLNSSISGLLEVRSFLVNLILWVRKKFILAARGSGKLNLIACQFIPLLIVRLATCTYIMLCLWFVRSRLSIKTDVTKHY